MNPKDEPMVIDNRPVTRLATVRWYDDLTRYGNTCRKPHSMRLDFIIGHDAPLIAAVTLSEHLDSLCEAGIPFSVTFQPYSIKAIKG